jgi:hypothetical protein
MLAVFKRVEAWWRLDYTLTGLFETSALTTTTCGATIPTLNSPEPHPDAHAGHNYLVTAGDEAVVVREAQRKGGMRYAVDQLANPRSVCLMPGGLYPPNVRLYGSVGTASDGDFSVRLCNRRAVPPSRRLFCRPARGETLVQGQRLTIGANGLPEYDLAVTEVKRGG